MQEKIFGGIPGFGREKERQCAGDPAASATAPGGPFTRTTGVFELATISVRSTKRRRSIRFVQPHPSVGTTRALVKVFQGRTNASVDVIEVDKE